MENPSGKKLEKDNQTKQAEGHLTEKDLAKIAGGVPSPRDTATGQVGYQPSGGNENPTES